MIRNTDQALRIAKRYIKGSLKDDDRDRKAAVFHLIGLVEQFKA